MIVGSHPILTYPTTMQRFIIWLHQLAFNPSQWQMLEARRDTHKDIS